VAGAGVVEAGVVVLLAWCFFFLLDLLFLVSDVDLPASAVLVESVAFAGAAAAGVAAGAVVVAAAGAAGAGAGAFVCAAAEKAKALTIRAVRSLLMICWSFVGLRVGLTQMQVSPPLTLDNLRG
jgi:hypothetical protein